MRLPFGTYTLGSSMCASNGMTGLTAYDLNTFWSRLFLTKNPGLKMCQSHKNNPNNLVFKKTCWFTLFAAIFCCKLADYTSFNLQTCFSKHARQQWRLAQNCDIRTRRLRLRNSEIVAWIELSKFRCIYKFYCTQKTYFSRIFECFFYLQSGTLWAP